MYICNNPKSTNENTGFMVRGRASCIFARPQKCRIERVRTKIGKFRYALYEELGEEDERKRTIKLVLKKGSFGVNRKGCVGWSEVDQVARGDYVVRVGDAPTAPPSEIYKQLQANSHRNTTLVVLQPGALPAVEATVLKEYYKYLLTTDDENGNVHKEDYAKKLRAELRACFRRYGARKVLKFEYEKIVVNLSKHPHAHVAHYKFVEFANVNTAITALIG